VTTCATFLCKSEYFSNLLKIVEFRALGRARGGAQNGAPRESQKMTNLGPDPFRTRLGRAKMIGNCMGGRSRRRKSGVGKRPPKKWSFSILTSRKFPPLLFDHFLSLFWTFLKTSKKLIKFNLFLTTEFNFLLNIHFFLSYIVLIFVTYINLLNFPLFDPFFSQFFDKFFDNNIIPLIFT
jgi:hypothetical protein